MGCNISAPEGLKKELAECGLAIKSIYADVAGAPFSPHNHEFAVVAEKRT